jgi:hypothetical protein
VLRPGATILDGFGALPPPLSSSDFADARAVASQPTPLDRASARTETRNHLRSLRSARHSPARPAQRPAGCRRCSATNWINCSFSRGGQAVLGVAVSTGSRDDGATVADVAATLQLHRLDDLRVPGIRKPEPDLGSVVRRAVDQARRWSRQRVQPPLQSVDLRVRPDRPPRLQPRAGRGDRPIAAQHDRRDARRIQMMAGGLFPAVGDAGGWRFGQRPESITTGGYLALAADPNIRLAPVPQPTTLPRRSRRRSPISRLGLQPELNQSSQQCLVEGRKRGRRTELALAPEAEVGGVTRLSSRSRAHSGRRAAIAACAPMNRGLVSCPDDRLEDHG